MGPQGDVTIGHKGRTFLPTVRGKGQSIFYVTKGLVTPKRVATVVDE